MKRFEIKEFDVKEERKNMEKTWWKERVFYQIYPKSFADSNNDGIGDLKGIIDHLDYLKELGIGALWLCPIYDSPLDDEGYDIRNYKKILPQFGTMEDFEELLFEAHRRDIKLIMDLVVNHSSDEHPWFIESRKSRDNPYRDYYIWRDGKDGKEPNNWASFFAPSAWKYDEQTSQWYLHLFSERQPDLNWENPQVRENIYGMINRWLDKGIDGFRMDVINVISKKEGLPDGKGEGYVHATEHFAFQPGLHKYLREMRSRCFEGREAMCVGETPFVTPKTGYDLTGDGRELDLIFHFDIVNMDAEGEKWDLKPFDLTELKDIIEKWQDAIPWNTLFWSNHDQPRPVSRFITPGNREEEIRGAKMLGLSMHYLKGTPFIYQGEEIGMTNYPFEKEEDLRDIESLVYLHESQKTGNEDYAWRGIKFKGRDNARTPFQWDNKPNGGFSDCEPWIASNPNYEYINAKAEAEDPDSVLNFYRKMIWYRNSSGVLKYGDQKIILHDDPDVFAYERTLGNEKISVFCNFSCENRRIPENDGEILFVSENTTRENLEPLGYLVIRESC